MPKVVMEVSGVLADKTGRTLTPVNLKAAGTVIVIDDAGQPPEVPTDPPLTWGGKPGPWGGSWVPPQPPVGGGGGDPPHPAHPIVLPPEQVPPDHQPNPPPAPGSPTTVVPGNFPVSPIVPPAYLELVWPGIGPVIVAPPAIPAPTT